MEIDNKSTPAIIYSFGQAPHQQSDVTTAFNSFFREPWRHIYCSTCFDSVEVRHDGHYSIFSPVGAYTLLNHSYNQVCGTASPLATLQYQQIAEINQYIMPWNSYGVVPPHIRSGGRTCTGGIPLAFRIAFENRNFMRDYNYVESQWRMLDPSPKMQLAMEKYYVLSMEMKKAAPPNFKEHIAMSPISLWFRLHWDKKRRGDPPKKKDKKKGDPPEKKDQKKGDPPKDKEKGGSPSEEVRVPVLIPLCDINYPPDQSRGGGGCIHCTDGSNCALHMSSAAAIFIPQANPKVMYKVHIPSGFCGMTMALAQPPALKRARIVVGS